MTIQLKYAGAACLIAAVLSAGLTRYYFPRVTVQTKVEVQKDVTQDNIKTIVQTMKLPSGEIDTTSTTIDNTVHTDTQTQTDTLPQLYPDQTKNWYVGLTSSITGINFANPAYGVQVNRRILGPLFIGGTVNTHGEFGVSVGMEF
jgi:hypothetical protein